MHYRSILAVCAAFAAAAADVDASNFVEGASGEPVSLKSAATVDSFQSDIDQLGHLKRRRAVTRPLVALVLLGVALATTYLVVQCFKFVASTSSAGVDARRLASGSGSCGEGEDNGSGNGSSVQSILAKMQRVKKLKAKETQTRSMLLLLQEQLSRLAVRRAVLELELEKLVKALPEKDREQLKLSAEALQLDVVSSTTSDETGDGDLDDAEEVIQGASGGEPEDVYQQVAGPEDGGQAGAAGTATGGEGGSETPSGETGKAGDPGSQDRVPADYAGKELDDGPDEFGEESQYAAAEAGDPQQPDEGQLPGGPEPPEGPNVGPAGIYGPYQEAYMAGHPGFFGPYQHFIGPYQGPFVAGPGGFYVPQGAYAPEAGFGDPHQTPALEQGPHGAGEGGLQRPHQGPVPGQGPHGAGEGGLERPHQGPFVAGPGGFYVPQGAYAPEAGFGDPHQTPALEQGPHGAGEGGSQSPHQGPVPGQGPHVLGPAPPDASSTDPSTQHGSGEPGPSKHEPSVPTKDSSSSASGGAKPKKTRPAPSGKDMYAPETQPRPGMSPSMNKLVGRFERAARISGRAPMTARDKAYLDRKQQKSMLEKAMGIRKEVDGMREEALAQGTYKKERPKNKPTPEERYERRKQKILGAREQGDFGSEDDD